MGRGLGLGADRRADGFAVHLPSGLEVGSVGETSPQEKIHFVLLLELGKILFDLGGDRIGVGPLVLLRQHLGAPQGDRRRFEAKLFGGANVIATLSDVGTKNAAFARQFLMDEGIAIIGCDVGGNMARRIQYSPVSGTARRVAVVDTGRQLIARELNALNTQAERAEVADVEFFDG